MGKLRLTAVLSVIIVVIGIVVFWQADGALDYIHTRQSPQLHYPIVGEVGSRLVHYVRGADWRVESSFDARLGFVKTIKTLGLAMVGVGGALAGVTAGWAVLKGE